MVINPKVLDIVKSNRKKAGPRLMSDGSAIDPALGPVTSMSDLSKEDFYKLISQPIPSKLPEQAKEQLKKKWITNKKQG